MVDMEVSSEWRSTTTMSTHFQNTFTPTCLPSPLSTTFPLPQRQGSCGSWASPSPSSQGRSQLQLAVLPSSQLMASQSQAGVPYDPESPIVPRTAIFERAMRRSRDTRDQTPPQDNTEDEDMDGYACESTTTSPCARLGDSTSTVRKLDFRSPRRVWESTSKSKYNRGLYFGIHEDASGKMSPDPRSPGSYTDLGEDKENFFATGSDNHSSMEPDTEDGSIDYDRLSDHQDAFGFVFPYDDALSELPVSEEGIVARPVPLVLNLPVPNETVRPVIRMGMQMRDEDEDSVEQWGTWEDTLNPDQIRELRRLSDIFIRESLQREARSRQYPMRDYENVQGSANIFMEARRITEYQHHQVRRRASEGDGA